MESLDLRVLNDCVAWRRAGKSVTLVTVVETWGSAPRPPGALLAVREDGVVSGSVSGGCVEDDLIARIKAGEYDAKDSAKPSIIAYGVSKEEAARFGLPCGGTLRLVQEPLLDINWVEQLLAKTASHEVVARTLNLASGKVTLTTASRSEVMSFDGIDLKTVFGPKWMAQMLDFEVLVCDPRDEYAETLNIADATRIDGMPDDVVRELEPDAHTAIIALTHDPKLDDMALLEALKSNAFYVGALGSARNQATRKKRLAEHFDMTEQELARLHGPVGLKIGAKTPAEIAMSIMAQIIEVKNAVAAGMPTCALEEVKS
jgi:xanthine dehydrogenase accessory factor